MKRILTAVALVLAGSVNAAAQEDNVRIAFDSGRVYLVAEALASDVLLAWARAGNTEIAGADLLADEKLSVAVKWIPESEALALILGEKYGYAGSPKTEPVDGTSQYAVLRIDTTESLLYAEKLAASQPENSYEYLAPEKTLLFEPDKTTSPEPLVYRVPEVTYSYFVPEKADAPLSPQVDVKVDHSLPPPENRYSYYRGEQYLVAAETTYELYEVYKYPLGDPETRYSYFIPPKAMP